MSLYPANEYDPDARYAWDHDDPMEADEDGKNERGSDADCLRRQGGCMSTALAAAFEAIDVFSTDPLHKAKCRALMSGYDRLYSSQPYAVLGVEEMLVAPLVNVDTGRNSRTFKLAGKLDVRLQDAAGYAVLMDHKTTSDEVSADSDYWKHLIVESQPSHYMLLEWLNGHRIDYCIWDVVRKPAIRPAQIDKKDRESMSITGRYCGYALTLQDWAEYDAQTQREGKNRETPTLYEARLREDCTTVRPSWYFAQRQVNRLDNELVEYARELWQHAEEIRIAIAEDRHPRSSGSCITYSTACRFLGICSGYDHPESSNWRRKAWKHAELPIIGENDGTELLTNSRIRNFQACRRRHQYDYLIGIERDEDRDSLIFGTLWHEAQAAWWGWWQQKQRQETEAVEVTA